MLGAGISPAIWFPGSSSDIHICLPIGTDNFTTGPPGWFQSQGIHPGWPGWGTGGCGWGWGGGGCEEGVTRGLKKVSPWCNLVNYCVTAIFRIMEVGLIIQCSARPANPLHPVSFSRLKWFQLFGSACSLKLILSEHRLTRTLCVTRVPVGHTVTDAISSVG